MRATLAITLLLVGCDNHNDASPRKRENQMPSLHSSSVNLEFTCKHETLPEAAADAQILFQHARWLQKNNQLKRAADVNSEVERLYRIAAEHGHSKANINLQNGAMQGHFRLRPYEHLRLSQALIDTGVATGYYFLAIFLQQGSAGLEQDSDMALRYFRKSADEGNAEAQFYVASKLLPVNAAPEIASQMYRCAAEQGHGEAAAMLGTHLKHNGNYQEAVRLFQMGVLAGDEGAAGALQAAFEGPSPENILDYLSQPEDRERAERYEKIWRILANYSYANPKVPEIDEIVPLPPAQLPPWDGKLQWLEERLANVPPAKPAQWLIEKLAREKVLDPATGRPKPGSPAFQADYFPADTCDSGEPCPQEGYWKAMWPQSRVPNEALIRHFDAGEPMPHPEGNYYVYRIWPLPKKLVSGPIFVKWGLLG